MYFLWYIEIINIKWKVEAVVLNLTITVPEALHERLQAVKKNFNVSQVCQKAIESEVNRQELLRKGLENMNDVIERLRQEKAVLAKRWFDMGYKAGLETLKTISYKALLIYSENRNYLDDIICECNNAGCDDEVEELSFLSDGEPEDVLDEDDPDFKYFDSYLYKEGLVKAVVEFYDKIKDEI